MNKKSIKKHILIALLLLVYTMQCSSQIQPTGCFSSSGAFKACGSTWVDYYNGQSYNCTCNCSVTPPAQCVPVSSHSGSGSSGSTEDVPDFTQMNQGDVSPDGQFLGKPLFTSNPSQAFEDWAESYRKLLESYGIKSILGTNQNFFKIPLTENSNYNKSYYKKAATFKPTTAPNTSIAGKIVPIMGNSPNTQEDREQQALVNKLRPRYIDMMTYIRPEKGIDASVEPAYGIADSKQFKIVDAAFDRLGKLPLGELPAYLGKLSLSFIKEVDTYLYDATINNKYSDEQIANMNVGQEIVYNVAKGQASGAISGAANSAVKSTGVGVMKTSYGVAGETDTKLLLKLAGDTKTTTGIWNANWQ